MGSDAEVALGVIRAVRERDDERLMELFHDDVQLHDAASLPYGGIVEGKASIQEQIESAPEETWLGTWAPVQPTEAERRMDPRVLSENNGEVVVLYHQRALAPDGERFDSPVIGLYEVRDGKLARAQMFHYDTAAINAFLERACEANASQTA
jgi:ketosteroid isomerase-like protein